MDSDPALLPTSDPEPHLTTWLSCLETGPFALVMAALFCENSSNPYIPATPYIYSRKQSMVLHALNSFTLKAIPLHALNKPQKATAKVPFFISLLFDQKNEVSTAH